MQYSSYPHYPLAFLRITDTRPHCRQTKSFLFRWKEVLLNLCLLHEQPNQPVSQLMATNPSSNLSQFIDNTWINQSPGERLRTIEHMQQHGAAAQDALLHIAQHDEHPQVRCGAIRYLTDIAALGDMQSADAEIADAARQQYHRLLAGATESSSSELDRVTIIQSLPLPAVKQIALLAKCKAAGSAALEQIRQPEELADLTLFAASVHVRKHAAMKISDDKLLQELYDKLRDKDKTVAKILEERLAASKTATASETVNVAPATLVVAEQTAASETEAEVEAEKKPETIPDTIATAPEQPAQTPATKKPKPAKAKDKPPLDPVVELPRIEQQLAKLSYKHTDSLNTLHNSLNRVRKSIAPDAVELDASAQTLHKQLSEKLEKNRAHQEHLEQITTDLLQQLQQALDSGQSHDALPAWDKIQGNISNTSGKIRASLQQQANVHKTKLNELRDWKTFAATEKKKELIGQMQHLLESKMHASDRSKHISKMHEEWKSLGRSNQNEQLWRDFKKLSDKAYEPCKEYFKQRKQLMAVNFGKRREICEQLEAEIARMDAAAEAELNISEVNKLLNEADKLWKEHAPIEQAKIKPLQKRYYAAINQLRKTRKQSLRGNAAHKLEFIAQANALAEHEDNQHAMQEAKRLQQEWKAIGPTSFKEDKKYWEDFRAACDKIFAKRNTEASAQRETHKQSENQLGVMLHALETILRLDDEALRNSRNEYQAVAQEFSNALDPRQRNQQKRLLEQFNGLKRKLDSRYKSLPDKKQLQLKHSVLEKAHFLQDIETRLLACQDDSQFAGIKDSIDSSAWQAIGASGDNRYDKALDERLQRVQGAASLDSLNRIAQECAARARALCIELEIRANIDSPKEDQGLRMQIQLDQLKNAFGKLKPEPKENSTYAMDIELQSYCLGPIEEKLQRQLSDRMEGAIKKLL